jgi:hypothetical protein
MFRAGECEAPAYGLRLAAEGATGPRNRSGKKGRAGRLPDVSSVTRKAATGLWKARIPERGAAPKE